MALQKKTKPARRIFLAPGVQHRPCKRAVSVWIPETVHAELAKEAAANHRSLSGHVSYLLEKTFATGC